MTIECGKTYSFIADKNSAHELRRELREACRIPVRVTEIAEHLPDSGEIGIDYDVGPFKDCYEGSDLYYSYTALGAECRVELELVHGGHDKLEKFMAKCGIEKKFYPEDIAEARQCVEDLKRTSHKNLVLEWNVWNSLLIIKETKPKPVSVPEFTYLESTNRYVGGIGWEDNEPVRGSDGYLQCSRDREPFPIDCASFPAEHE